MEKINDRIARLRNERKLTQGDLGKQIGVSRIAVLKWESGQIENLKFSNLTRLKEFFGVSYNYLIEGEEGAHLIQEPRAEYNVTTIPAHRYHDKEVFELAELFESMNDRGKGELMGHAKQIAKMYPKAKANHAS